jgi:hypothetical protein
MSSALSGDRGRQPEEGFGSDPPTSRGALSGVKLLILDDRVSTGVSPPPPTSIRSANIRNPQARSVDGARISLWVDGSVDGSHATEPTTFLKPKPVNFGDAAVAR